MFLISLRKHLFRIFAQSLVILSILSSALLPKTSVQAEASLSVTPITWNIVGLDSNNVNVGPNTFPVGARVCNSGDTTATNLTSTFNWLNANAYIKLRTGTSATYSDGISLEPGACYDYFYEVEVVRNSLAYNQTRRYSITFLADGGITGSTPIPREIFVERLVSQSRNSVTTVFLDGKEIPNGGAMELSVGNTYNIQLVGNTSTNGYNQLESFINLPNTIFRINSVSSTYSVTNLVPPSTPYSRLYADSCGWNNNPLSPTYRSCIISDGKTGGLVKTTYNVTIISGGGSNLSLNTMIYDFSGSSYHYNSDFSSSARVASIISPVSLVKAFAPVSIVAGGTTQLTFTIGNLSDTYPVSDLYLVDPLPSSPAQMTVATTTTTTSGCGDAQLQAVAGTDTITLIGGSISAGSTCSFTVPVTAPSNGTYSNSSENFFINGIDTGLHANATLTVAAQTTGTGCTSSTLALWNFPTGSSTTTPVVTSPVGSTGTASIGAGLVGMITNSSTYNHVGTTGTFAWGTNGNVSNNTTTLNVADNDYFEFRLNTAGLSSLSLGFWGYPRGNGPLRWALFNYPLGGTMPGSPIASSATNLTTNTWNQATVNINSNLNSSGVTVFRIYLYNAQASNSGTGDFYLDDVAFSGCSLIQPELTKSFSPSQVIAGEKSTLTFTLKNQNTYELTQATFTDGLPEGMSVASPLTVATTCTGGTFSPISVGDTKITFANATIPAGSNCTASVLVTTTSSGTSRNTSGYLSTLQTGTNTGATGYATAMLSILESPIFSKQFTPNPIYAGTTSTLTFSVTNPNDSSLSGIAWSDPLPGSLVVNNPSSLNYSNCSSGSTPVIIATSGTNQITVSNVGISPGETCSISVLVYAVDAGSFKNDTSTLTTSKTGLTAPAATDTLIVNTLHPALKLLKQVATSTDGPWTSFTLVTPGEDVYYRLTVENVGDVDFSSARIFDPSLDISSCLFSNPFLLPVSDPIKECIVGPFASATGSILNTATVRGTYNNTVYSSSSTAQYIGVTLSESPDLTLQKQVGLSQVGPWYSSLTGITEGTEIYYKFTVLNSGSSALYGIGITDNKLDTSGCSFIDPLNPGDATVCIVGPVITLPGTNSNTASAHDNTDIVSNDDIAIYTTGTYQISGTVWEDANADGSQAGGEPGLENVSVALYQDNNGDGIVDAGDTYLGDQQTDQDGGYSFTNLPNGNYLVLVISGVDGYNLVSGTNPSQVVLNGEDEIDLNFGYQNPDSPTPTPTLSITETETPTFTTSDTLTFTPTETETPTPSDTPTFTFTPSDTPSFTPTDAETSTSSDTPTFTFTPSDTPTFTPTDVDTPTPSDTPTFTPTDVDTPTPSDTPTFTPTDAETPTPSDTATFTFTPSDTPTFTPTDTETPTPSDTSTFTPTDAETPTPSDTVTFTFTPSDTPTFTPTDTETPTPSDTATFTPANTATFTPSDTPTFTFTPSDTPTNTHTPSPTMTFTPSITPTPGMITLAKAWTAGNEIRSVLPEVTIGETITYQVQMDIPVGTRHHTLITDQLDAGLAYIDCLQISYSGNLTSTKIDLDAEDNCHPGTESGSNPIISGLGQTAVYDFGTLINSGASTASITITYTVVVLDTADNLNGDTQSNIVTMSWDGGEVSSTASPLQIIEPALSIDKESGVTTALPGSVIRFTIRVWHLPVSSTSAYDVVVTDHLPTLLSLSGSPIMVSGIPWSSWNYNPTTRELTFSWDELRETQETVIAFDVTLGNLTPGTALVNEAYVEWTTLPGDFSQPQSEYHLRSTERWYDPGDPTDIYYASDTVAIQLPETLPATGFAPNKRSVIPNQPSEKFYTTYGDLLLEIPQMNTRLSITGVPLLTDGWDLTWLWNQAGWLEGTTFPTHSGNSVITGHVYLPDGTPGPFMNLKTLKYGDQIIIHAYGQKYVYEVRNTSKFAPGDMDLFRHETYPVLSLLTCQSYDAATGEYAWRYVVRAIQVKVEDE